MVTNLTTLSSRLTLAQLLWHPVPWRKDCNTSPVRYWSPLTSLPSKCQLWVLDQLQLLNKDTDIFGQPTIMQFVMWLIGVKLPISLFIGRTLTWPKMIHYSRPLHCKAQRKMVHSPRCALSLNVGRTEWWMENHLSTSTKSSLKMKKISPPSKWIDFQRSTGTLSLFGGHCSKQHTVILHGNSKFIVPLCYSHKHDEKALTSMINNKVGLDSPLLLCLLNMTSQKWAPGFTMIIMLLMTWRSYLSPKRTKNR